MLLIVRLLAILEGISYLLLFGFSMPLKYWASIREPNIYIGYVHGFLFIAFIIPGLSCFAGNNNGDGRCILNFS